MITANDLRQGTTIELEGTLYVVEEFQHVKRGRGGAFVRTKLKNLRTLETIREVFQPGEKLKDAFINSRKAQYLYREGDNFQFMDLDNFEEKIIPQDFLGKKVNFLSHNLEVTLNLYEGRIVDLELPSSVELEVKKSSPGLKGDTVGSATKPVTLESGYTLRVPLFIKEGDLIRVDTRTGEYLGKSS